MPSFATKAAMYLVVTLLIAGFLGWLQRAMSPPGGTRII
jgi:hypothetical protein